MLHSWLLWGFFSKLYIFTSIYLATPNGWLFQTYFLFHFRLFLLEFYCSTVVDVVVVGACFAYQKVFRQSGEREKVISLISLTNKLEHSGYTRRKLLCLSQSFCASISPTFSALFLWLLFLRFLLLLFPPSWWSMP